MPQVSIVVEVSLDGSFDFATPIGGFVSTLDLFHGMKGDQDRISGEGMAVIEIEGATIDTFHPGTGPETEEWAGRWIRVRATRTGTYELWRGIIQFVGSRGYAGSVVIEAKTRIGTGQRIYPKLYENTTTATICQELVQEGDFADRRGVDGSPYSLFDDGDSGFDLGVFKGDSGFSDVYDTGVSVGLWGMHLPEVIDAHDAIHSLMRREWGYFVERADGQFWMIGRNHLAVGIPQYTMDVDEIDDIDLNYGTTIINQVEGAYVVRELKTSQVVIDTQEPLAISLANPVRNIPLDQEPGERRILKPDTDIATTFPWVQILHPQAGYVDQAPPPAIYENRGSSVRLIFVIEGKGRIYLKPGFQVTADVYVVTDQRLIVEGNQESVQRYGRRVYPFNLDGYDDEDDLLNVVDWLLRSRSMAMSDVGRVVVTSETDTTDKLLQYDVGDKIKLDYPSTGHDAIMIVRAVHRELTAAGSLEVQLVVEQMLDRSVLFDDDTHGFDDAELGFFI
jgi:hypothetical protein